MNANTKNYSIIFDYLRVFAMLGVLAVHFAQAFPFSGYVSLIMWQGACGVQIFFVISAYLACSFFVNKNASIKTYYKKRALRILPTYYAAIVAVMVYITFLTPGYKTDSYHLGWLRYFLGINMLIPATDFSWNNAFGFWTMSMFIFFYTFIPFIIKYVNNTTRALLFFIVCFFIAHSSHNLIPYLPDTCASPQYFIECGPLYQMQFFSLGILTFFATKENKRSLTSIFIILLCMLPSEITCKHLLIAGLTSLFILNINENDIMLKKNSLKLLQFASKYSFHVYLTHGLALAMAARIGIFFAEGNTLAYHISKLSITIILIFLLCIFLEISQRITNKIFDDKKKALPKNNSIQ